MTSEGRLLWLRPRHFLRYILFTPTSMFAVLYRISIVFSFYPFINHYADNRLRANNAWYGSIRYNEIGNCTWINPRTCHLSWLSGHFSERLRREGIDCRTGSSLMPGPHQQQCRSNIAEATVQLCCLLLRQCCWCRRGLMVIELRPTDNGVDATDHRCNRLRRWAAATATLYRVL